jgi:hypothetical protein
MRRPITAADRIAARFIPSNYTLYREVPGGVVYASPDKMNGIAFRGSAMNPEFNYRFRNPQQLDQECEKFSDSIKAHQDYKEKSKATRNHGETDTQKVKKALKDAGFNVTSVSHDRGTARSWINVKIDEYESEINEAGRMVSKQGTAYAIAMKAAGRENCHDDPQTDYFCERMSVDFTKYHRCSECVISDCQRYHEPESHACGTFTTKEMSDRQHADYLKWKAEQDAIKAAEEARKQTPEYIKEQEELELIRKAEAYEKECEANREKIGHPWVYDGHGNRDNIGGPRGNEPVKQPWEVKEIIITRAEGLSVYCGIKKYFDSFQSASSWLYGQSFTFPKTGGYDKHDFKITFMDGETYEGRLDCKSAECEDPDLDVLRHVRSFQEYYKGDPKHGPAARAMLEKYLYPLMRPAGYLPHLNITITEEAI